MKNNKLDYIQLLRGVAALLVIAFHFRGYLNDGNLQAGDYLFNFGESGIDIFFVISGFIITYSTEDYSKNSPYEFALKRFFRLYPVFLFTLFIALLFSGDGEYNYSQIVKSLMLIPNDYNFIGPWYGYNINTPAWTLTYEVLFYILFMVGLSINHKHRTVISIILLISVCCVSQYYFRGFLQLDPITRDNGTESVIRNLTFLSNPILYDFIYGMIIAEIYTRVNEKTLKNIIMKVILVAVLWLSVSLFISGYNRGSGIERWGLYSFLLVGSVALLSKTTDVAISKFWLLLGDMSYSLYINHIIVRRIFEKYTHDINGFNYNNGLITFCILMILTFISSYITYNLIEKPSIKLGRKVIERIKIKKAIRQ